MSEAVQSELIRAVPALLGVLVSVLALQRVARVDTKVDGVQKATEQLEENTNHKMDIVIEAVRNEATALGRAEGQSVERERGEGVARALVDQTVSAADTQVAAAEVQKVAADIQMEAAREKAPE